ncbi:hypothetical protein GQ600_1864 [Phytophthora cactorum]|nr:hypothetical protein GQ600_1864 [Phytophthora cactorum]
MSACSSRRPSPLTASSLLAACLLLGSVRVGAQLLAAHARHDVHEAAVVLPALLRAARQRLLRVLLLGTLGVWPFTLPARASEPWTLPPPRRRRDSSHLIDSLKFRQTIMLRLTTRALAAHGKRSVALAARHTRANVLRPLALFSTAVERLTARRSTSSEPAQSHQVPYARPGLQGGGQWRRRHDADQVVRAGGGGCEGWHAYLESGDEGFIARLLVNEGSSNVAPGQPLAIIVPTEEDIEPFVKVLKENPR